MRPQPTLTILAVWMAPLALGADPPSLDALVGQLGAADYRTRESAHKQLSAAGDRALPALKAALATRPDPEVSRRLEVLIAKLEAERLTTARRVTLKSAGLTAKAALAEIARQSGYTIRPEGWDDTSRYPFDLNQVPFWQALDQVCHGAGLSANLQDDTGTITVFSNDVIHPFVAYSGPFRILAVSVTANQNIQLSGLPRFQPFSRQPDYLSVNFQVMSEPKAPLIGIGSVEPIRALDETGGSLLPIPEPDQPRSSYYSAQPAYRSYSLSASLNLTRSDRSAAELRELRAKLPVLVLTDCRPDVVIPDLVAAKGRRVGGRELDVEIHDVVAEPSGRVLVTLLVTRRLGAVDDYAWLNGLSQRIEAIDEAGRKMPLESVDQTTSGPNATTMSLQFGPAATGKRASRPSRLVIVEWVTLTTVVDFTLKNVPLP